MKTIKSIFKEYFNKWLTIEIMLLSLTFKNFFFFILFMIVVFIQLLYYNFLINTISKINIKLNKNDRLILLSLFKKHYNVITSNHETLNLYMNNLINSYLLLKNNTKNKHLLGINYVNILNIIKKIKKKKMIKPELIDKYLFSLNSKKIS